MKRHQVVVVGAGPAGAATAYHLALRGRDVLLLDKDAFPREKVCGDGLTPRCVDLLRAMGAKCLDTAIQVPGVRVWDLTDGSFTESRFSGTSLGTKCGAVVTRLVLDSELCEIAVAAGAKLWTRTLVTGLERRGDAIRGVRVVRDGKEEIIEASVTVVAEGSAGRLRQSLRPAINFRTDVGYAVRQYIPNLDISTLFEVFFPVTSEGLHAAGYGWIFPAGDAVNIGAGFFYGDSTPHKINVRQLYHDFTVTLRERLPEMARHEPLSPLIGAPLRIGLEPQNCHGQGWLLVGDAAGVINPFTGEGISYALETGCLAAAAIHDALGADAPLSTYASKLTGQYPRHANLRSYVPKLFGLVERNYEAMFAGRIVRIADRRRRSGPVRRALKHLLSDRGPAKTGLSVVETLASDAEDAHQFTRAITIDLLADLRSMEPLVSEALSYVLASSSALVGLPAALVWSVARSFGGSASRATIQLAASAELFAAAHLMLATLRQGGSARSHHHSNDLQLLWGDLLLAEFLRRLSALPSEIAGKVLDAATDTMRTGLMHSYNCSSDDIEVYPVPGHCVSICCAAAAASANLAGAPLEVVAWTKVWATHVARAHRALGEVVSVAFGDDALGLPPPDLGSFPQAPRKEGFERHPSADNGHDQLLAASSHTRAAMDMLATLPPNMPIAALHAVTAAAARRALLLMSRLSHEPAMTIARAC